MPLACRAVSAYEATLIPNAPSLLFLCGHCRTSCEMAPCPQHLPPYMLVKSLLYDLPPVTMINK